MQMVGRAKQHQCCLQLAGVLVCWEGLLSYVARPSHRQGPAAQLQRTAECLCIAVQQPDQNCAGNCFATRLLCALHCALPCALRQ